MTEYPNSIEFEEKIPTNAKVAYGFANAGNGLLSGLGLGAINLFYLKVFGIDPSSLALSWILFIVWNSLNDPILGIIEDKTKSKLGRRIPYLRYGSIIYAISFIFIWFPFVTTTSLLFLNHLLMLFIFDTLYSMIGLITYSLPAEMALTAKERANIILFSVAIGAIGVVGSLLLPIIFLGNTPNILGFRITMILCGVAGGTMIYLSSYYIKENKYTQLEESLGLIESVKETFKNKAFLILEVSIFAMVVMQNILQGYLLFIIDYVIDFDLTEIGNLITLAILIALLIFMILKIGPLIQKYGLRKFTIYGSMVGIFGFGIFLIIGLIFQPTASHKLPLIYGAVPLAILIFALFVYMFTNQPLMGDAIDNDELLTGKRRETSYSGVNALLTKPAVSIGNASFLWIIAAFGYKSDINPLTNMAYTPIEQPASVAMGVIVAFTVVPMLCLLIAVISLKYFPLDGPDWFKKKQYLQEVHARKEREYIERLQKEKINK